MLISVSTTFYIVSSTKKLDKKGRVASTQNIVLRRVFGQYVCVILEYFMEKADVDVLISKDPSLERERQIFEKFSLGAYCLHRSFGMGQITGYDAAENKLLIEFDDDNKRRMDPEFCARKLEMMSDSDMLVQFRKSPKDVRKRLSTSAVSVLIEYLEQLPDHKASLGEIAKTFGRIVDENNLKKWWQSTRKLIAKEPRLSFDEGNVTYLRLCDEPVSEEDTLKEKIQKAVKLADKVSIAEKCMSLLKSNPTLAGIGAFVVEDLNDAIATKSKRATVAEILQACIVRDEVAKATGVNTDSLQPKVESIVSSCSNITKVCSGLPYVYYHTFLGLVTRVFPDEWEKLCFNILKNCNSKLTNECITYLKDNGCSEALKTTLAKWLKEKSLKSALLLWIIKNRHAKKFEEIYSSELMSPELLRAALWAIDNESIQNEGKAKKIPLVELLVNDRSLIHDLLLGADDDVAGDLAQTLLINQGIDTLTKKSLLARFISEYPNVQELVLSSSKTKLPSECSLKVSLASLEEKRKEYDILVKEKIPANKKAIEVAREHGDLSENSEYKMARQDQDTLLARKAQLENELRLAEVIDMTKVDISMVSIGTVVTIKNDSTEKVSKFTILGAWDSDPDNNVISYKTPMAQSLLGKKVGDTVILTSGRDKEDWQIEKIVAYEG